ncbi:MAG: glycosyltransferase family 1 protein [Lachnospiraceae bacterium]|nr:glycosyltransferase family 1 protein [Lachnospiraceae bacterium]
MRIVLFYSGIESFNYFTNQLVQELKCRNHEVFVLDLRNPSSEDPHSYANFTTFLQETVDLAICFDGFGLKEDLFIELWNAQDTMTINILMDHPLRFHPTMERHPRRYVQFCCDLNHVAYVKKYFGKEVAQVEFMPHAGTLAEQEQIIPFSQRTYDILFSGTYYRPEEQREKINQWFPEGEPMNQFYKVMADYMLQHSAVTTEQAALDTIRQLDMQVSDQQLKTIFRCSEPLDWMVRMYQRERVIQVLAEAGFDLWLLGRGWENHPSAGYANVHRINDRIPFAETLPCMADAKINLNVMPWFKAGTHDRIFNILLQHSLPLTDTSSWIDEHFAAGEEIAIYDLEHLENLPQIVEGLLNDERRASQMIEKGYEKTKRNYTWKNCVDQIFSVCGSSYV